MIGLGSLLIFGNQGGTEYFSKPVYSREYLIFTLFSSELMEEKFKKVPSFGVPERKLHHSRKRVLSDP
jgi:hypothetical protein